MNKLEKILFISRHSPNSGNIAREAIDAVLAAGIYDQDVSLLFMDDGVFQLLNTQNTHCIEQKNITKMLSALNLYGIDNIYVHGPSLTERSIEVSDIIFNEDNVIDTGSIKNIIAQQKHILSF